MIAKEIINSNIPTLKTSDSGQSALDIMDTYKITHLPIVNNNEYAIHAYDFGVGALIHNIIWGRAHGLVNVFSIVNNFMYIEDYPYQGNNFSLDPEFCGVEGSGNYFLQSDSPCAPGNSPYPSAGLIGALPINCGTVDIRNKTWGEIKAIYGE